MKFRNWLLVLFFGSIFNPAAQSCGDETFRCRSDNRVIFMNQVCDGKHDCLNGEDESRIMCNYCPDKFHCNRNPNRVECIEKSLVCDGERDCSYGEDESARFAGCKKTCTRNEKAAAEAGRPNCRKICTSDRDCKGSTKRCLCDYECGMSCVNIEKTCLRLRNIPNLESIRYVKWTTNQYREAEEPFDYDVEAHHKCKPGYEARPNNVRLCHGRGSGDGDWTKPIVCAPACSNKNLSQSDRKDLKCGSKCITDLDCPIGFSCDCDGACGRTCVKFKVECPDAPSIENADIEYTGEDFARVANYICKEGMYAASGDVIRNCRASGEWDGVPVRCEKIICGNPACSIAATRGHIVNNPPPPYCYKTTLRFACAAGQRLVGSSERMCMANGLWSGRLTVCQDKDAGDGKRCPHPGVPIDGYILGRYTEESFKIGKEITFRCNEGFTMTGDAVQKCLAYQKWSGGGAPLCIDSLYKTLPSNIIDLFNEDTSSIWDVPTFQTKKRIIQINEPGGIEIYFLIDLSMSVCTDLLKQSMAFAKGLVKRVSRAVSEKNKVKYGITVFAKNLKIVLDVLRNPSATPEEVVETLENIELEIEKLREQIGVTTNIQEALRNLYEKQISVSFELDEQLRVKRHCFVLTDGEVHPADNPENTRKTIERAYAENPPEFYSVISKAATSKTREKLRSIASRDQNVIYIADLYKLYEYIDEVTDAREDYSICGQVENVGEHRNLAQLGRVVGGTEVKSRAWPWQVLIHLFDENIVTSYSKEMILGAGSLINSKWVLSAAHVFWMIDDGSDYWHEKLVLSMGITRRPTSYNDLEGSVEMYQPEKVYIHKDFVNFIFTKDIALIKIGGIYTTDRKNFKVPTAWPGNVTFTPYIRPVCLPCSPDSCVSKVLMSPDKRGNVLLTGDEESEERCNIESEFLLGNDRQNVQAGAFVTGFGHNKIYRANYDFQQIITKELQQGLMKIEQSEVCKEGVEIINREIFSGSYVFNDEMLCARSAGAVNGNVTDACKGDGGGPLVREVVDKVSKSSCFVQIGIISWGHGCADHKKINLKKFYFPAYFTKVAAFNTWIQYTMKNHKEER